MDYIYEHQTRQGKIHKIEYNITLGGGTSQNLHIHTPDTGTITTLDRESKHNNDDDVVIELLEGPTLSDDGTVFTDIFNMNREYPDNFPANVYTDATITSDGTIIDKVTMFSRQGSGSIGNPEFSSDLSTNRYQRILSSNEDYVVRISNNGANQCRVYTLIFFKVDVR